MTISRTDPLTNPLSRSDFMMVAVRLSAHGIQTQRSSCVASRRLTRAVNMQTRRRKPTIIQMTKPY